MDIKLPELGEGIESGDVISVLVSEGDQVEKEQGLIELETDKASVEIPSTHAGKVTKIHVQAGDTLEVGGVIVSLETADAAAESAAEQDKPAEPPAESSDGQQQDVAAADQTPEQATSPPQPEPTPEPTPEPPQPKPSPQPQPQPEPAPPPTPGPTRAEPASPAARLTREDEGNGGIIPAGPAMRRFAREVGVDLRNVSGSGPGGRIQRSDILRVVREGTQTTSVATAAPHTERPAPADPQEAQVAEPQAPQQEKKPAGEAGRDDWGPVRIEKMPKIRQTIAAKMHESWTTIPRVTNFDDADVTELEKVRQSSKEDYASAGIKLTQLPFVIKACAMSLRSNPIINASVDLENGQIIYKDYVNIGIAVDTPRGLIVPSLRDADRLSIPDIARELATLAEKVRLGNFDIGELRGSTFTISNLGAIGGTYSTPIINPPEVAILLIGRARKMPVVAEHQFAVRLLMPLSISYDHRLVDGAAAARFLNDVKSFLQSPSRLLLAP